MARSSGRRLRRQAVILVDDGVRDVALAFLEFQHFFFHGILGDQTVGEDGPCLADPVRPVYGLGFYRRVPPRIQEKHILGGREVQPQSAGFEADQE